MRILDKSLKAKSRRFRHGFETFNNFKANDQRPSGLLLVTGPTGSGKTTTVYSLMELFNHSEKNIITIEDPVEYRLEKVNQVQVHAKAGITFPSALRSMLRQDPDVIVVGEIRDKETAEIAIRAALTGHLVISTLHTNDSVASLSRLMDMGIEPYLISSSLLGILSQRLIRILCPHCRTSAPIQPHIRRLLGENLIEENALVGKAVGCAKCNGQGFKDRVAIYEMLSASTDIKDSITKGAHDSELLAMLKSQGFTTLREHGIQIALKLETTADEVLKQTI